VTEFAISYGIDGVKNIDYFAGIGFLNDLFYERSHIAGPGEVSIAFPLDEKPPVVPVGSAGERSRGARKIPYGAAVGSVLHGHSFPARRPSRNSSDAMLSP